MPLPKEMSELVRKYAIKNALDYGRARAENVLGKIARSVPKEAMDDLRAVVSKVVDEVNALPREQLMKEYSPYEKDFEQRQERKAEATSKPRMVLEGATAGNFATRFAPEPSGYIHVGHASAAFLAQEFSRIYNGKLFLYFDDTNPEKETQEFVDSIKRDLAWLGIKFDREYYASDSIERIYGFAAKLVESGKAYTCECTGEETKRKRFEGLECTHRNAAPETSLEKLGMMLDGKFDEEKIVLRIKGDMKSQNTALRDPTIMRVKKHRHYRQGTKYVVWPTYDFNTPINDSINGITDVIRTREYELRNPLYYMVLDYLGLQKPRMHLHARVTIKGQPRQKREIRKLVDDKLLMGYDDPRLVTIAGLRRRGIQPVAIREFVLGFGMSMAESVVDIAPLLAYNKRLVDGSSKRLYYVSEPASLEIKDFHEKTVDLRLHPTEGLGTRRYTVRNMFHISGDDAAQLKDGNSVTLKGLFTLSITRENGLLNGKIVNGMSDRRVQWVCDGNYTECKVLAPGNPVDDEGNFINGSLKTVRGYIESYASDLKEKEIVQLERFGFCILDDKEKMQFIFISK